MISQWWNGLVDALKADIPENYVVTDLVYRLRGEHIVSLHYDNLLSLVVLEVLTEPLLVNIVQRVSVDPQQVGWVLNSEGEQTYFWHRTIQKLSNKYNQIFFNKKKIFVFMIKSSHLVEMILD